MSLIEEIHNEYRNRKTYGIQFSIEPEAYLCNLSDERIVFGDNTTAMQCGVMYNWQDVIIDGKVVGYLEEKQSGRLFDPQTVSFCVILADCTEPEKITDEMRQSPHFYEDETFLMKFATMQQMIDYLEIK